MTIQMFTSLIENEQNSYVSFELENIRLSKRILPMVKEGIHFLYRSQVEQEEMSIDQNPFHSINPIKFRTLFELD